MIPTASKKYRQRLDALFSEIERLAENPVSATAAIRCEIEALRTRVQELEAEFLQNEKSVAAQDSERNEPPVAQESSKPENVSEPQQRAGLILYEKERVGYAYSDDTMAPLRDTDPVMINGKNSVAVPLMAGGQAVGEMRIAPPPEHTLTSEEISLTNAVAQQVSLQVQTCACWKPPNAPAAMLNLPPANSYMKAGIRTWMPSIRRNGSDLRTIKPPSRLIRKSSIPTEAFRSL